MKKGPTPGGPGGPNYPLERPQLALLGADRALRPEPAGVLKLEPPCGARAFRADASLQRVVCARLGRTNNSSLVLAFEFLDTKRVMLFVGDAQIGNWLSWQKVGWRGDATTAVDFCGARYFTKLGTTAAIMPPRSGMALN